MNNPQSANRKNFVKVKIEKGNSSKKEYFFKDSFSIGRAEECSIQIDDGVVSRVHIDVKKEDEKWWIFDNQSSNGTFIKGDRIDKIELSDSATLVLGNNGPVISFSFESPSDDFQNTSIDKKSKTYPGIFTGTKEEKPKPETPTSEDPSLTKYINYYFNENSGDQIGEHTKLVREAFKVVKKKHTSKYLKVIIVIGIIALAAAAYSIYQQVKENKQKQLAENIFYDMKSLELEISSLKDNLADSKDPMVVKALEKFDDRYKQLEKNYESLVNELGVYNLNEEEQIIVKVARTFGECELAMPEEFMTEVKNYIKRWQSSKRLYNALERAKQQGFIQVIVNYLERNKLPHQFFYLALQESDFREQVVGPPTRYGYAKGIWQFISETGERYGLKPGPLADQNIYDPADDRYNFPKATSAAARYIKDIYNTDAQASGLLVMASYNWGEYNIIKLIRTMPENPRDRNFWKLLEKYREKIPEETYNYVFYIFSAAVIGENPKLFGFNFDNPLKDAIQNIN